MSILTGERPGVFIDYDRSSVIGGSASDKNTVLIAAFNSNDSLKTFYSAAGAAVDKDLIANPSVMSQANAILSGGVSALYIIPVGGTLASYTGAFNRISLLDGVSAVVCDSDSVSVHKALAEFLDNSADGQKEYLGFVSSTDIQSAKTSAETAGCMRLVMVGQGGALAAAAVCGAVMAAAISDPLYGLELPAELTLNNRLTEAEIDDLVRSGVTPLEKVGGRTYSIRTVTTKSTTDGVFDRSLLDLQVVRINDYVLSQVRTTLRRMLGKARSNAKGRLAISTQVRLVLENMVSSGLISAYDNPVITENASDSSVCTVSLGFNVARGYSRIYISAVVSV